MESEGHNTATMVTRDAYNRLYNEFDKKCRAVNEQSATIERLQARVGELEAGVRRCLEERFTPNPQHRTLRENTLFSHLDALLNKETAS